MEWRAKSTLLASDQGLKELTDLSPKSSNRMVLGIFASFLVACILFSTTVAVLYLADVEEAIIKVAISLTVFLLAFAAGIVYICVFN